MKLDEFESGMIYIDVNIFYMYLRKDAANLLTLQNFFLGGMVLSTMRQLRRLFVLQEKR